MKKLMMLTAACMFAGSANGEHLVNLDNEQWAMAIRHEGEIIREWCLKFSDWGWKKTAGESDIPWVGKYSSSSATHNIVLTGWSHGADVNRAQPMATWNLISYPEFHGWIGLMGNTNGASGEVYKATLSKGCPSSNPNLPAETDHSFQNEHREHIEHENDFRFE